MSSKKIDHLFFNFNSILRTSDLISINNPCVGAQNFPTYLPAKCFLEAVAFELAIKIYFEIDNNKEAPHTHNLGEMFPRLSETSRKDIENIFAQEVVTKAKLMENVVGKKLYIPEFKEAIRNNSEMVMNFKYSPVFPNGSLINLGFLYKIYRNLENRLKK